MKQWLRAAASLALLAAAIWLLDVQAMAQALGRLSLGGVVAALVVTLLVFALLAWRWYLIIQPLAPRSLREHLKHYLLATFINAFTPANLGGDAYRLVSLRSQSEGAGPVIVAVVKERMLGLLSYLLACPILAVAALLWPSAAQQGLSLPFQLAAVGALAAAVLLAAPILTRRIARMELVRRRRGFERAVLLVYEGMSFVSPRELAGLLTLSLVGVGLWVAAVQIVAIDLGIAIAWPALGLVVVLAELLRMVPTTIQGVGMREAAFAYLVGHLGGSPESGFVLGGIGYLILTLALAVCGTIGWILVHAGPRK